MVKKFAVILIMEKTLKLSGKLPNQRSKKMRSGK
jgi:hypothetical protein